MKEQQAFTATDADWIDREIQERQPNTLTGLKKIANSAGVPYSAIPVRYMGFHQGYRLKFTAGSRSYVRPKKGFVYAVPAAN